MQADSYHLFCPRNVVGLGLGNGFLSQPDLFGQDVREGRTFWMWQPSLSETVTACASFRQRNWVFGRLFWVVYEIWACRCFSRAMLVFVAANEADRQIFLEEK